MALKHRYNSFASHLIRHILIITEFGNPANKLKRVSRFLLISFSAFPLLWQFIRLIVRQSTSLLPQKRDVPNGIVVYYCILKIVAEPKRTLVIHTYIHAYIHTCRYICMCMKFNFGSALVLCVGCN